MSAMQSLGAECNLYTSTRHQPVHPYRHCRRFPVMLTIARASKNPQHPDAFDTALASDLQKHVGRPTTLATAVTGFSLIAAGVFIPASRPAPYLAESAVRLLSSTDMRAAQAATNQAAASASDPTVAIISQSADFAATLVTSPLLDLDQAVHTYVTSHTTVDFRSLAADIYISDVFITLGIFGWLICSAMCVQAAPKKAAGPLALAWTFYFTTCGAYGDGDPELVDFLKHVFARIRPSPMHHTFSFPSGHTSAAVFIVGALVTVLLPFTVQLIMQQQAKRDVNGSQGQSVVPQSEGDNCANSSNRDKGSLTNAGSHEEFWRMYDAAALSVWAAAWATTATGRVLADAHWVSDTLAGGCLAIATVSGLAWSYRSLEQGINSSGSSGSNNAA